MTSPFLQPGGVDPTRGVQPTQPTKSGGSENAQKSDGPAFRALLEKLQAQAAQLEQTSKSVEGAEDLPGAVDEAKASLEDAVSLSDQLLEAFRQSQVRPDDLAESA